MASRGSIGARGERAHVEDAARPWRRRAVTRLTTYGRGLDVTDLDQVLFRGEDIRKGDVLNYYWRVTDTMFPHVKGRPLPFRLRGEAVGASAIPADLPRWVRTMEVDGPGEPELHVIADEPATLAYLAQRGCVTLHAGLAQATAPSRPDCLLFDVDPIGSGASAVAAMCEAARLLRWVLQDLGLIPFVMTTGSRGLHVRVPIVPEPGSEVAIPFSRHVVDEIVRLSPDRIAGHGLRLGLQEGALVTFRGTHTSMPVAPYALRDLPGAPVATPLDWDEIEAAGGPRSYDISNIYQRLESQGDPWKDMTCSARSLACALLAVAEQPVGGEGTAFAEA